MYEFASVAGLVGVIAFLAVLWKLPALRHLGGFVLLPVILVMFLAGTVLYSDAQPLVPALQSYWLAIHVSSIAAAEGILLTSAALTGMFLIRARYERGASNRLINIEDLSEQQVRDLHERYQMLLEQSEAQGKFTGPLSIEQELTRQDVGERDVR